MSNLQKWKILDSELVLTDQWCQVRRDRVVLANGTVIDDYFVNLRPDTALVFPITEAGEVIFVRQYRHGIGEIVTELPAGAFDPQIEEAKVAAARELEEETGYIAPELIQISTLYNNPGKDTTNIHVFLAENVIKNGNQQLDETEDIEIIFVSLSQLEPMLYSGEIRVSGTIAALFLGLNFLKQTGKAK